MDIGLVCERCDAYGALTSTTCEQCGAPLELAPAGAVQAPAAAPAVHAASPAAPARAAAPAATSDCPQCGAVVPNDMKFCGNCGARAGAAPAAGAAPGRTMFFGAMQTPGRAKLILIKGEGLDGVSYHLTGSEHVTGRQEGQILFPEDPLLSPRHANFIYSDGKLFVRDEGSANGIFLQIRKPQRLDSGDIFLIGEQLLRVEASPPDAGPHIDEEGTYFYGSPKRPSPMRIVQIVRGGDVGLIYRARSETLTMGREGNDLNFPDDPFISGRHAQVHIEGDHFSLSDLGSKNGTFVRLREEMQLAHGDYVFLGQQLLRVEIV